MDELLTGVRSTGQLREDGIDGRAPRRAVTKGDAVRIRRGAYRPPGALAREQEHRMLVAATLPGLAAGSVVSHASAAVLHGLLVRSQGLDRVHVTRPGHGRRGRLVHVHTAAVPPDDVVRVAGLPATSLTRTLADLGRTEPLGWSVASIDDALHRGRVGPAAMHAALAAAAELPGVLRLRAAVGLADGRAESPGESLCRFAIHQAGLPAPVPQFEVRDRQGLVGRVDLGWPEQKVAVEFDGRVKYSSLLRPGESAEQALWREKRREDRLRAAGWVVIRVVWDELLRDPAEVCRRIAAALYS